MDLIFANIEGWPGIADPTVKDFIAAHQLTAIGWFVDAPHLTVVETRRMQGNQRLLDAFIDDYSERETKDAADMTEDELRASHQRLEALLAQIGSGGVGAV